MNSYQQHLLEAAPTAVRRRIRRRWEQRRIESGGRSEAYMPGHEGFGVAERILTAEQAFTLPARANRPERPRPLSTVYVRLVQPR